MSRSGVRVKYIESSDVHAHEPMLAQDIVGLFECASDSSLNPMNLSVRICISSAEQRRSHQRPVLKQNDYCLIPRTILKGLKLLRVLY